MTNNKRLMKALSIATILPQITFAWTWEAEPTPALKERLIGSAAESGHGAFAKRIAASESLTDWIGETIDSRPGALQGPDVRQMAART